MALAPAAQGGIAVEIAYSPTPLRLWTGETALALGGKTYAPGGILAVGEAGYQAEEPVESLAIELSAATAAERQRYLGADPGPLPVTVTWLLREEGGAWQSVAEHAGRVAETEYADGAVTVTVRATAWDVDRGETLYMDNATQQRLHPGDLGFGYMSQLLGEDGPEARVPWPPG